MLTYEEAYRYIIRSYSAGVKHDQSVLRGILAILGNPQNNLKTVHVAGTNGKGSVCAMISSVLMCAGYSVGMFTSPHLERFNERFRINGEILGDADFAGYVSAVKDASHIFFGDETSSLSYFELLTACAFLCFSDMGVDYSVVEVGIGGRLDATNVIENPVVSVITSVSIDHTELLGDTIAKIAVEKAGIIKKNCKVVLYLQGEEVYNIINSICTEKNGTLYYADDLKIDIYSNSLEGVCFSAYCEYYKYERLHINLLGEYQIQNSCTALLAVTAMRDYGINIPDTAVYEGMAAAEWAGRLEIVGENPLFILDGAHNIDAAVKLHKSIENYFGKKDVTLILAVLKNKDYESVVNILTSGDFVKNIIFSQPNYKQRAVPPVELAAFAAQGKNIYIEEDYQGAVDKALEITDEDGVICCGGSLYLVGDVRKYLLGEERGKKEEVQIRND